MKGYIHSKNDYSIFLIETPSGIIIVIYVDYILVMCDENDETHNLKSFLHDQFKIKYLDCIHYFMGLEIHEVENGMVLHQQKTYKSC